MLIEVYFILISFIAGLIISELAKDELKVGKKWFRILIISSIIGAFGSYLYLGYAESMSFIFIFIILLLHNINFYNLINLLRPSIFYILLLLKIIHYKLILLSRFYIIYI